MEVYLYSKRRSYSGDDARSVAEAMRRDNLFQEDSFAAWLQAVESRLALWNGAPVHLSTPEDLIRELVRAELASLL